MEIWKFIDGTNGLYEVSNIGRVRSNNSKSKVQLKPVLEKVGYVRVCLRVNKKPIMCYVHRLVAMAFIDNPESKKTVNHKNGNKSDNTVDNLEWMTMRENNFHATYTGLRPGKLSQQDVIEIRENKDDLYQYELAKRYNTTSLQIHRILTNKIWIK